MNKSIDQILNEMEVRRYNEHENEDTKKEGLPMGQADKWLENLVANACNNYDTGDYSIG